MDINYPLWIPPVLRIAKEAAVAIMESYKNKKFQIKTKADLSPVTEADIKAHDILIAGLHKINPHIPILSEEGPEISYETRAQWPYCWLVDPIDGTKEFIQGTGEFTINIALIQNHRPVLGVVYAPAFEKCYWAIHGEGEGAYVEENGKPTQRIRAKTQFEYPKFPIRVALSRYHERESSALEPLLKRLNNNIEAVYCGSALKLCLVAEGAADFYPRFGPTFEWDTAAGQCILEVAGGKLVDFKGQMLNYNFRKTLQNPGFLAVGSQELLSWVVDK